MSLQIGDSGAQVRSLQQQLAAHGFSPGRADGQFGPNTQTAVQNFQRSAKIGVDGKAGPQTFQKLRNTDSFTPAAGQRTPAQRTAAPRTAAQGTTPAQGTTATPAPAGERPYQQISRFAQERGFQVTSTTGGHHLGAAHRQGRAADIRTNDHTRAQVDQFISQARAAGYTVFDERGGGNSAWTGPHVHVQAGPS